VSSKTKIEWTDASWNPILGCSRVSEGCRHCYAEGIAGRFSQGKPSVYSGLAVMTNGHAQWTGKIVETRQLLQPLSWRRPRRVFVNSMSDLFHPGVSDELIDRIFAVMALAEQHTFQILTKRPERMLEYCYRLDTRAASVSLAMARTDWWDSPKASPCATGAIEDLINAGPLPNVWLGVSVENQAAADERIPLLLKTPAAVRFISAEPLLGPVSLAQWGEEGLECECGWRGLEGAAMRDEPDPDDYGFSCPKCGETCSHTSLNERLGEGLNWVICGGESGPQARPMHPDWARSLRDQCKAAGVPFFFKQQGEWIEIPAVQTAGDVIQLNAGSNDRVWVARRIGKKAAGALLDGVEHRQFPEAR
jgi:protein gp37